MGCCCSKKDDGGACGVIINNSTYLDATLSNNQKRILRDNWSILSVEKEDKGRRIFMTLFDKNPLIKGLFPFRNLEGKQLSEDASFKAHAQRFMNTMELIMVNLDRYKEVVAPQLVELGRRHTVFPGFKPGYFNHFEEAMLDVFQQDLGPMLFDARSVEAWRMIFRFIMMELKRGHTLALRDKSKQRKEVPTLALAGKSQKIH